MSPVLSLLAAISSAPPVSALAAQLRDIHPGPMLVQAPDPRLQGWWALLIILLMGALIGAALLSLLRYRRWQRQIDWQAHELVPRLQAALREAALGRWPEARTLQGEAWLAFLDRQGGSQFREFAPLWPHWLYGQGIPDPRQREALRRAYLRWGRACCCLPQRVITLRIRWQQGLARLRARSSS
ncbi:DUF4381 domain-containing protein [Aeromonas sp.]|uniref:DUF4381 domain-containing protein n=1 Tax=Aeromonas sp. TaxID=647 RepID=UPI0025803C07|nr:DUF4381 domain-containing protein [Aeromonas sp.]